MRNRLFRWLAFIIGSIAVGGAYALPLSRYDLNGDGVINTADAFILRDCIGQTAACNPAADYDGDGTITLSDYAALTRFYGQKVTRSNQNARASVSIAISSWTAQVNQSLRLTATLSNGIGKVAATKWYFQDGSAKTGAQIDAAFASEGVYTVTTATPLDDGGLVQSSKVIVVTSANGALPAELGLPTVTPGDVDGSLSLTLKDAYLIYRLASGVTSAIPPASLPAADANLDGVIDLEDARLTAVGVLNNSKYFEDVAPSIAVPGTVLTIRSAALTAPTGNLLVRFGDSGPIQPLLQFIPGVATVMVPATIAQTSGSVSVILLRSNIETARFHITLSAAPPPAADPVKTATALLTQMKGSLTANTIAVNSTVPTLALDSGTASLISAIAVTMEIKAKADIDRLIAIMSGPNGSMIAKNFLAGIQANGFPDLEVEILRLASATIPSPQNARSSVLRSARVSNALQLTCDVYFATTCEIHNLAAAVSTSSTIAVYGCSAVEVIIAGLAVTGVGDIPDLAIIPAFVAVCGDLELSLLAASVIADVIKPLDIQLHLESSDKSLVAGQTARLTATADIFSYRSFCLSIGAAGAGKTKISEVLTDKIVNYFLNKNASGRILGYVFGKAGRAATNFLITSIRRATTKVVDSQAVERITDRLAEFCSTAGVCDQAIDTKSIVSGEGADLLVAQSDKSALFTCPATPGKGDGKYEFTAMKTFCDKPQKEELTITCASGDVTFTFGDNGSLLDDIFELVVDGVSVLSSNTPVRATSITLGLTLGQHAVELVGRAAPDGIGTYYLTISGAQIVSGDALSGTDLTPGVVKAYTIQVQ